jgi:hypothetical protein
MVAAAKSATVQDLDIALPEVRANTVASKDAGQGSPSRVITDTNGRRTDRVDTAGARDADQGCLVINLTRRAAAKSVAHFGARGTL